MTVNQIQSPLLPIAPVPGMQNFDSEINVGAPTFLDVFKTIVGQSAETQEQKAKDILDTMLGDVDDLERVQANIAKAQIALDLLVNVRNVSLEAYNEIIKMSI